MKRALIYVALAAGGLACAAGGYWLGFRDAWYLSISAASIPRAVVATHQLRYLRSGRPGPVIAALEFDVDKGLSWAEDVFDHPLRDLWKPVWGLDVYPGYERYVVQLASFRRENPSLLNPDSFDRNPGLVQDARD